MRVVEQRNPVLAEKRLEPADAADPVLVVAQGGKRAVPGLDTGHLLQAARKKRNRIRDIIPGENEQVGFERDCRIGIAPQILPGHVEAGVVVGEMDHPERKAERQREGPHFMGPSGPGSPVTGKNKGRCGKRPRAGLKESAAPRIREGLFCAGGRVAPAPDDCPPQRPCSLRKDEEQGRQDRTDAPDGRQIKEKGPSRHGRVQPGDGFEQDQHVHGKQQADGRPREENGQGLEAIGPLRGPDSAPDADEEVYLGEYRETDDDEPKGAEG